MLIYCKFIKMAKTQAEYESVFTKTSKLVSLLPFGTTLSKDFSKVEFLEVELMAQDSRIYVLVGPAQWSCRMDLTFTVLRSGV